MSNKVKCSFCGASGENVNIFRSNENDDIYICADCVKQTFAALRDYEEERVDIANVMSIADKLTASREAAATKIEKEMRKLLVPLGIPNVQFAVNIGCRELCLTGKDSVSFLFCANKGGEMQPVTQVASGGEIV